MLYLFGQPLTFILIKQIACIFFMSWLIGFLTPGASGGLGIREAIMIVFLGSIINSEILISSTIFYRLICIAGDITALLMAFGLVRAKNS
jgi:uncharacterized membrane protein YbhN (UPF0104 family)